MLKLPIYLRGNTYYLHARIQGKQFKRSLKTLDKFVAMEKSLDFLKNLDLSRAKKYEIDLNQGKLKANDPEDHKRLLEALEMLSKTQLTQQTSATPQEAKKEPVKHGLKLFELLDKFLILKPLKPATVQSYKHTLDEFKTFLKNPFIQEIMQSDISRYQEYLATTKKNSARTIDDKVGTIRSLLNFAIKQGYLFGNNPASNRNILTKRQKLNDSWAILQEDEIHDLFTSDKFKKEKENDPDFYWCCLITVLTALRVSEVTSLKNHQFKKSIAGFWFIRILESKTEAGKRDIPIPDALMNSGLSDFIKDKEKVFKYRERDGKGSGNAVGKKFRRLLEDLNLYREKVVFHSVRKFVNDYFKIHKLDSNIRKQFMGHENEDLNNQVYSNKLSITNLKEMIDPIQNKILELIKIN